MYIELKAKCNVCGHQIEVQKILLDTDGESLVLIGHCPRCEKTRYAIMPISDLYLLAVKVKMRLKKGNGNDTS